MTVKLLIDWPDSRTGKNYVAGNLLTTDAATEAGMVAAKIASSDLTGGSAYIAPAVQKQYVPVTATSDPLTGVIRILMPDGMYASIPKQSDAQINYVAWGLTLPTGGTIGVASIDAGVAYVSGNRVTHAGSVLALSATKDNYVDIDYLGNVIVSPVTVGAAAPALAASGLRLGKLTTDATTVTTRTTRAKDSNGNWMYNDYADAHCAGVISTGVYVPSGSDNVVNFGAGTTSYDNTGMHSESINPARFTCQQRGVYDIDATVILPEGGSSQTWTLKIYKNGASAALGTMKANAASVYTLRAGGKIALLPSDYIEVLLNFATSPVTFAAAAINLTKVA